MAFIIILVGLVVGFLSLFTFRGFRFTWTQWPFFAALTCINALVLVCCAIFAILCRIHFDEGLTHYCEYYYHADGHISDIRRFCVVLLYI